MIVYDLETYPNFFSCVTLHTETKERRIFEVSERYNTMDALRNFLSALYDSKTTMIGFNNVRFDYPILHQLIESGFTLTPNDIYSTAQECINSEFPLYRQREHFIPQLDLFLINHYDNPAKSTSLKYLEFVMRSESIIDLPYEHGSILTPHQMEQVIKYNCHDVNETYRFYRLNTKNIEFRKKLGDDYTNDNDTKIGTKALVNRLPPVKRGGTPRTAINVHDILLPCIKFKSDEFNSRLEWFRKLTVTDTKGVFKNIHTFYKDFQFDFGLGGIHGSVKNTVIRDDIHDYDVTSYYPSIGIVNKLYPEHLGEQFCTVYESLKHERKKYPKGSPENDMLKLALNGVYGNSNNQYSPFYDPQYTMSITINGQLMLCMLAERLIDAGAKLIQINTDGLTFKHKSDLSHICKEWEQETMLDLEYKQYAAMFIRDVNNYIALGVDGSVKRKGAYEYVLPFHKNHSALIVPKAAEAFLLHGTSITSFIHNHTDYYDFLLCTRIPRSMRLYHGDIPVQRVTRYYISTNGEQLVKHTSGNTTIRIHKDYNVSVCNDLKDFDISKINYNYYIDETEKLVFI